MLVAFGTLERAWLGACVFTLFIVLPDVVEKFSILLLPIRVDLSARLDYSVLIKVKL
jgi:hypothetical protein